MKWRSLKFSGLACVSLGVAGMGVGGVEAFNSASSVTALDKAAEGCYLKHQQGCTAEEKAADTAMRTFGGGGGLVGAGFVLLAVGRKREEAAEKKKDAASPKAPGSSL